jgi:uncharacterized caspase-like protein
LRGWLWIWVVMTVFAGGVLRAEPRIALVIGNGAYEAVGALPNPARDADLMARTLTDLGFDVTFVTDSDLATMQAAISDFGRRLREAGEEATGLFYYAGHGVQSFGRNYLLPTDAALTDAADLSLVAVEAEAVLRQMASARNRTNIFILDACRNNPFPESVGFGETGLAEMNAPAGTYIAYATSPGRVALDGAGENSPFTEALTREIMVPGKSIEEAFKDVRVAVMEATGGAQTPWDTSLLTSDFAFAAATGEDPLTRAARELWEGVQATSDPVAVMLYLRAYPDSPFRAEAETHLESLLGAPQGDAVAGTPPAEEVAAFEAASALQTVAAWEDFAARFPDSLLAEAARIEIAALAAATETGLPEGPLPARVVFNEPLTEVPEEIAGKSIADLIAGSPLYPPIEGLPDEVWKEQTCSHCHQWTQADLCVQAQTYATAPAERTLSREHPLGTAFRGVLRVWAEGGCE